MAKLQLSPKSGPLSITKDISFSVKDLENKSGLRISIENATFQRTVKIDGIIKPIYLDAGITEFNGKIDLDLVDDTSQNVISIYATVEEKVNETYKVREMLTAVFILEDNLTNQFKGNLDIYPSFIGLGDKASINIKYDPDSRLIVTLNDKRFVVLTDNSGNGSLSFVGKDIVTSKNIPVIQKFRAYISDDTSSTINLKTDSFIHILPSNISMHASQVENTLISDNPGDIGDEPEFMPPQDPTNPHFARDDNFTIIDYNNGGKDSLAEPVLPTPLDGLGNTAGTSDNSTAIVTEKKESTIVTTGTLSASEQVISVQAHDVTQTPYGKAIHAYVAMNKGGTGDVAPTENDPTGASSTSSNSQVRVYLSTANTALDKSPNAQISSGIVSPNNGNVILLVHRDIYAQSSVGNMVQLLKAEFEFSFYKIIRKLEPEEYIPFYRFELQAEINVLEHDFCVPYLLMTGTQTPSQAVPLGTPQLLPAIQDNIGRNAVPVNVSVACSKTKIYNSDISYIYVIAEAVVEGVSQLFFYAITTAASPQKYGWKQLTSRGENRNPKALCDGSGNLHIFWDSNRSGLAQIYYGVLGPSANSLSNAVLSSAIDKQVQLFQKDKKPFAYTSDPIIFENTAPDNMDLIRGCDEYAINGKWVITNFDGGLVTFASDQQVRLVGNPSTQQVMAWTTIDRDEHGVNLNANFDQRAYAVEFYIRDMQDNDILNDLEISDIYQEWLDNYTVDINSKNKNTNLYIRNNNKFHVSKTEKYYDRMIPIFGTYQNSAIRDSLNNCGMSLNEPLRATLSGCNANVRHFIIGLLPEKIRFVSTNSQSYIEYCEEHGGSITDCQGTYIPREEKLIYTGHYRLIIYINGEVYAGSGSSVPYTISRKVSEPFTLDNFGVNIRLALHYRKMYLEDAAHWLGERIELNFDDTRYLGSMILTVNNEVNFSESFIADFCKEDYYRFDLGFGFPGGGMMTSNHPQAYETCVYENKLVDLQIDDIKIGVPQITLDPNLVTISQTHRNTSRINVVSNDSACDYKQFTEDYSWLNLGLNSLQMSQIPITFEGVNENVDAELGPFCNDIHVAWQSNREKYWDIYYAMSLPATLAFRHDTRVTNTESDSLAPQVSVDANGERVVVWHEKIK